LTACPAPQLVVPFRAVPLGGVIVPVKLTSCVQVLLHGLVDVPELPPPLVRGRTLPPWTKTVSLAIWFQYEDEEPFMKLLFVVGIMSPVIVLPKVRTPAKFPV
jgi:hypothetical protein